MKIPTYRLEERRTKDRRSSYKNIIKGDNYMQRTNTVDLTGRRFGLLTVVGRTHTGEDAPRTFWHCRCDCGRETDVFSGSLLRGLTRSCGCLSREISQRMHEHMHYQDDTCIEMLKRSQKNWAENKAGHRGLFITKDGRYRASITFRKVHYTLGYYKTFDEAVDARLSAERQLHAGYIEAFERYEAHAQADPQWAEGHPFYYDVSRDGGEFQISTNG